MELPDEQENSRPATSLGYSSQTGDTVQFGTFDEGSSWLDFM
jgi:hypothetical protein